jgi:hypothetical protein
MAVLKEYKGDSPMYDLSEALREQMTLPLDVTFSDLKGQVREMGDGRWRVFHAPHLVGLSRFFFSTVNPVLYRLEGERIYSHVKFTHPLLGTSWLSASGAEYADCAGSTSASLQVLPLACRRPCCACDVRCCY